MRLSLRTWLELSGLVALGIYAWLWHTRPIGEVSNSKATTIAAGDSQLSGRIVGGTTYLDEKGELRNYGGTVEFSSTASWTRSSTAENRTESPPGAAAAAAAKLRPRWRLLVAPTFGIPRPSSEREPNLGITAAARLRRLGPVDLGLLVSYETKGIGDLSFGELRVGLPVGF